MFPPFASDIDRGDDDDVPATTALELDTVRGIAPAELAVRCRVHARGLSAEQLELWFAAKTYATIVDGRLVPLRASIGRRAVGACARRAYDESFFGRLSSRSTMSLSFRHVFAGKGLAALASISIVFAS